MLNAAAAPTLRGRRAEREALDRLVDAVRAGRNGALVLRGEAGIGKTALLEHLVERASGFRIAQAAGVESEMELAFAGLHQLCAPFLDRLDRLPDPQREALGVAFGLCAGDPPERLVLGLGVLGLLSEIAGDQPLLCVVDDVQWLDCSSAQTLAFVARRLPAKPVGLVFALREGDDDALAGLPQLTLRGLPYAAARSLLDSAIHGRLDARIRDRIIAETRGNPLALLELPRGLTPAELAGGFGLPDRIALTSRIEASFLRRLRSLPRPTQRLLLTAAADPVGDAALVWRAAEHLGVDAEAAAPAEAAELIEFGARVRFRHPLVRSAAYQGATVPELREVHGALAEASDPHSDPDRRAWHRAHAASGPDEALAAELERSASVVQGRGGIAAAAAFLERATELTADPARRGARALAAAQALFEAAAIDRAFELLATADLSPLDELQRARLERLRARLMHARNRGRDAPRLLLAAARRLEPLDTELAREAYLDALGAAIFAGRSSHAREVREAAEAALAAPPHPGRPRGIDILLDGLAVRFTEGYAAAVPLLRCAVQALTVQRVGREDDLRFLWLACSIAHELWDDAGWDQVTARAIELARRTGALTSLPVALTYRAGFHIHAAEFAEARALIEEADAVSEVTGAARLPHADMVLAAWRGDEAATLQLIDASVDDAATRGEGRVASLAEYVRAILYNGLGQYEAALGAAKRARDEDDLGRLSWNLIELVEAAARAGDLDTAADAVERLEERTCSGQSDWALGIEARSRALISDGPETDALYRQAVARLARSRVAAHRARTQLVYGEWLRRNRRRVDAREQLRAAYETFERIGAEGFAGRARRELVATGETLRRRDVETRDELTAQEAQIARLASEGLTNAEIAGKLFISPRTVEWHMSKVFGKLGIASRRQLRAALPDDASSARAA